jgi:hypothetical protein
VNVLLLTSLEVLYHSCTYGDVTKFVPIWDGVP